MTSTYKDEKRKSIIRLWEDGCAYTKIARDVHSRSSFVKSTIISYGYSLEKRIGLKGKSRKYNYDLSFFKKIDTEGKAYFLGLMYADGNVSKQYKKFSISLKIGESERNILQKFAESLKTQNRPREEVKEGRICFDVYSDEMAKDLALLGCVPCKSKILRFPTEDQVPSCFIRHFIRGYFDGDGCICWHLSKSGMRYLWSLAGTPEFLTGCKLLLDEYLGHNISGHLNKTDKEMFNLRYSRHVDVCRIKNFLYDESSFCLERKFKKIRSIPFREFSTYREELRHEILKHIDLVGSVSLKSFLSGKDINKSSANQAIFSLLYDKSIKLSNINKHEKFYVKI